MQRLLILCLVMFFVGLNFLPITDPVESNYVLTAKEMVFSGDLFSPRIYGNYWFDKPIMFYWELIASFKLFGISEASARLFPAIFASFGVFLTYFFGKRIYDKKTGMVAAVVLATSLEYWYIAHAVITDMTLFVAFSVVLIAFYLGYSEKKPNYYYISYAAAGIAVLTKGPIGFLLPGTIILLFLLWQRDLRHFLKLRLASGMILFLAIISVWYYPMYLMHGEEFISVFFGTHNALRATVSEHPQFDVCYYYLVIFIAGFIPWVFMVLPATVRKYWKQRKLPVLDMCQKFLLVWGITVPVVFQCFATKYITYTFPYMMPVAILFALYFKEHDKAFQRLAIGTAVVFNILYFAVAVPLCDQNSEKRLAQETENLLNENDLIVSYGRRYPTSFVFYAGREVFRMEDANAIETLKPHGSTWSNTNVMPFIAAEDLPQNQDIIALVGKKKLDDFKSRVTGEWECLKEVEDTLVFKRYK